MDSKKFSQDLLGWWTANGRKYPWRERRDPYSVFVSEALLHRTRAEQVLPVFKRLVERFPSIELLAKADPRDLSLMLRPLGLSWRVELLLDAARKIVASYHGRMPRTKEELMALPGVGEYIASAMRCFALDQPEVMLDTNTVRILGRVFGERTTDASRRSKRFLDLGELLLDATRPREFNYALIDLAAILCRPKNPICEACPVRTQCQYGLSKMVMLQTQK